MTINRAAWLPFPKASTLEVKEAPYPELETNTVIVKVEYVAINPLEYKIQDDNPKIGGKDIQYPTILGADAAGVVIAIGPGVRTVQLGQRVIANVSGLGKASAAFQHFIRVPVATLVLVPEAIPLDQAVVLPLACDTASAALFTPGTLHLSTSLLTNAPEKIASREAILIWGGSSSVGCCAIQLANAAGYDVYTTASKRNHDLCKSIGARQVFDHSDPDVVAKINDALRGQTVIGALDCISNAQNTIPACVEILARAQGQRKMMTVLTPPEACFGDSVEVQRLSIPKYLGTDVHKLILDFMSAGLSDGRLHPKPDALLVGTGLESIQAGIDAVRRGQSATKVIVQIGRTEHDATGV